MMDALSYKLSDGGYDLPRRGACFVEVAIVRTRNRVIGMAREAPERTRLFFFSFLAATRRNRLHPLRAQRRAYGGITAPGAVMNNTDNSCRASMPPSRGRRGQREGFWGYYAGRLL